MKSKKIKVFGQKYILNPKKVKSSIFQPRLADLKAINILSWYIIQLCCIFKLKHHEVSYIKKIKTFFI